MRIYGAIFLVLFQILFLLFYLGDFILNVKGLNIFDTPITLIVVILVSISLFIYLWVMNIKETEFKVAATESILKDEFNLLVSSVQSDRHDINNHLAVVSGLIQLKKNEQADEYIRNLIGDIEVNNHALAIRDPMLAALIYAKSNRFRRSNISFDVKIESNQITSILSTTDTVRLLTNLLDNAFDAVSIMPNDFRVVQMQITQSDDELQLTVTNTTRLTFFDNKLIDEIKTTKSQRGTRGFGLGIIREIVKKYDGHSSFAVLGDMFQATIIFPLRRSNDNKNE